MSFDKRFELLRTFVAVLIAIAIAFVIVLFVSDQPISSISYFLFGPLRKGRLIGNVIELAIPLIFSGVATGLLFQTSLFNLGSEGIYYMSGLIAAIIGIKFTLPNVVHPIVAILLGSLFGMILMLFIGFLKAKLDASELVVSLMFNSILYGFGLYILNNHFRDPNVSVLGTFKFNKTAKLTTIIPGTRIHTGLILALIVVFLVHVFLFKTKWGYGVRMTGINRDFAKSLGISPTKSILLASLIAGTIAGMGGSVEILGMYDRFTWAALPGLGFDGALVAMLGKNKPINCVFSALFLAYIRIGADIMARSTNVPNEMVDIIQAIIILLISGRQFLANYKARALKREAVKA